MNSRTKTSVLLLSLALAGLRLASPGPALAPAGLIDTTGSTQMLTAPENVSLAEWESDGHTRLFQERQGDILGAAVNVDMSVPGEARHGMLLASSSTIAAGTAVDSWFLHQDKVGDGGHILTTGSITFDTDILGIIYTTESLDETDSLLGAVGTLYGTGREMYRGLDLPNGKHDAVSISDDRRTLTFTMLTADCSDQIRIITAAVPSPGAIALLALSGLAGRSRRRRA